MKLLSSVFRVSCLVLACLAAVGWPGTARAAAQVTIKIDSGQTMRGEVLRMSRTGVVLKTDGKEQTLPLEVLTLDEVKECFRQSPVKDAQLHFDMGAYFVKKQQWTDAETELAAAVKEDPKLAGKAAPLLKTVQDKKAAADAAKTAKTEVKDPGKTPGAKDTSKEPAAAAKKNEAEGGSMEDALAQFKHAEVPPRTPEQMKEFLDKRLADLKEKIGGPWRMIETKHFYCFGNMSEERHNRVARLWNEAFYAKLCEVLRHKEGEKLWNNKCPIYYFQTYSQFQKFAVELDNSPFGAHSGGYFASQGREVHICIPFMTERYGEKGSEMSALRTLKHEGTHAFLQLAGEDVPIPKWLHEGLAQFIEFWTFEGEEKNNTERKQRADSVVRQVRSGSVPSWSEMHDRPMGGMDLEGYGWAWTKLEFLYRAFLPDTQKLPNFIRALKAGKKEDEAFSSAFGMTPEKVESHFNLWVKDMAKNGFNFGN